MTQSSKKAHYESMLFNYETTSKTDFREGQILPMVPTVRKERPKPKRPQFTPVKFVGSMTDWKNNLPFGALIKPKEILQTNPGTPQKHFMCIEDLEREKVQQTRPRLVMTPAVSIDDITPESREIIVKAMYTTEMEEKMQEAATLCSNIKAPLPDFPSPANPIYLRRLRPPLVAPEWRMDSVLWDKRQLRSSEDATQYFWMQPEQEPTRCSACEETAQISAHRKRLMK